ncbi:hypothetical protein [Leifsonia sp. TF02-11]|uniref:hypothetical protein n=1 Tax=Leifsonia sp. TF02-11 TaxID=2815212 RepID=UPI001AA12FA8|nr:hypothetical protein [Leifsonia sp. TF02-11]MBO1738002.1 hypothetical protein [Leifsonia sp. TF02-11]
MREFEIPLGNAPKVGAEFHLVRWSQQADAWTPETILVTYVSSTPEEWVVERAGSPTRLSREEWLPFQP